MKFNSLELSRVLEDKGYIRGPFGSSLIRQEMLDSGDYAVYEQHNAIYDSRKIRFYIDRKKFLQLKRFLVKEHDLIISCSGTVGKISIIDKNDVKGIISQALLILRPNQNKILSHYLKYFLETKKGQNEILNASHGSVQTNIAPRKIVEKIKIPCPEIQIQKKICDYIKTIDKKIDVNKKMNKTYNDITNALFKSWFVDFDPVKVKLLGKTKGISDKISKIFPETFEESELGKIPKGWTVKLLKKVVDEYIDNRGKTPPLVKEGIPLIEVKNIHDNSQFPNLKTNKHVDLETFRNWFRKHVKKYDVIISTVGTIGLTTCVYDTNFVIAQNLLGLRFSNEAKSLYMFNLIKSNYFQRQIQSRLVETVQKSIKRKDLDNIPILVPSNEVCNEFFDLIKPSLEKQFKNEQQNELLESLKNAILPKIINGELNI